MSFNSKYTGEQVESILDNILTEDKVRLIHFENKEDFNTEVANGNILDNSIVFIQDTKEIWNHGTYFPSGKSVEEIENIVASSETVQMVMEQIVKDTLPVKFEIDGDGSKYLNDKGEYITIEIPEASVTEEDVANWGFTKNKGTVTGVQMNGSSLDVNDGIIDLGNIITNHQDISGKLDSITAASTYATKTEIYKPLVTTTLNTMALDPNVYNRNTNTSLSTLTITLNPETNSNILNEYLVEFTTRSSGTTVILPASIKWAKTPVFEGNTTYQISIVNNLGVVLEFK